VPSRPRHLTSTGALHVLDHLVDRPLHEEGALGEVVVVAGDDLVEAANRLGDRHVNPRGPRELLGHVERLGQEALDLARPLDDDLVLVRELVDAQDRDDVLELLVALEDLRLENGGGRVQRIHRRVDPLL
jgi:hypothetical protein